jgi:hypothetical protein
MAETFSAFGIPQEDIARLIGITAPTLREHYREELDLGLLKANAKVAQNLFTIACKPNREGLDAAKILAPRARRLVGILAAARLPSADR